MQNIQLNFENLCVIKSTVPPNTTNKLYEKYKLQLIHNPEFLSAKTAKEDFRKQKSAPSLKEHELDDDQLEQLIEGKFKRATAYYAALRLRDRELVESD